MLKKLCLRVGNNYQFRCNVHSQIRLDKRIPTTLHKNNENNFLLDVLKLQQKNSIEFDIVLSENNVVEHFQCKDIDSDELMRRLRDEKKNLSTSYTDHVQLKQIENSILERCDPVNLVSSDELDQYFRWLVMFQAKNRNTRRFCSLLWHQCLQTKYYLGNKQRFLNTCFLLNLFRQQPPSNFKIVAEQHAQRLLCTNQLHVHEAALVASAFFKTQTKMSSKTVFALIYFVLDHRDELTNSIAAACILKGIRYCDQMSAHKLLRRFIHEFTDLLPNFDFKVGIQLQLVAKHHKCFNLELQQHLIRSLMEQPAEQIRIKDIDRLLRSFIFFNKPFDDEFLNFTENFLRMNQEQAIAFPFSGVTCLTDLMFHDRFPTDLIQFVFDHLWDQIKKNYKEMWFNIKMIDTLLRIYQPALYSQVETKLNMLPKCERSFDQSDYMKKLIRLYRSGQQIFQGDSFYVHLKPILPFCYYPELIVSLNASDLAPDEPIKLQRKAYERKNLYVVVCETFNCFSDMEYTIPAGLHVKRLACLRDLGFKVIVVEHADWVRFNRTQQMEQKWNELRSMIAKQNHESV